jgi:hypothetical protein
LGTTGFSAPVTRMRVTIYQFEAAWRVWQRERSALQLGVGLGSAIPAYSLAGEGLPATTDMGVITAGARYLYGFTDVLGAYAGVSASASGVSDLVMGDRALTLADGTPIQLQWTGITLAAGVLVRF